jgi:hypothetical protein
MVEFRAGEGVTSFKAYTNTTRAQTNLLALREDPARLRGAIRARSTQGISD